MTRHIVMWHVQGASQQKNAAARQRTKAAFEGLSGLISGLRHIEAGLDTSGASHACDAVLVTDFESVVALKDYAQHPEHQRVRRELEGLRTSRLHVD